MAARVWPVERERNDVEKYSEQHLALLCKRKKALLSLILLLYIPVHCFCCKPASSLHPTHVYSQTVCVEKKWFNTLFIHCYGGQQPSLADHDPLTKRSRSWAALGCITVKLHLDRLTHDTNWAFHFWWDAALICRQWVAPQGRAARGRHKYLRKTACGLADLEQTAGLRGSVFLQPRSLPLGLGWPSAKKPVDDFCRAKQREMSSSTTRVFISLLCQCRLLCLMQEEQIKNPTAVPVQNQPHESTNWEHTQIFFITTH